jgi:hypothetical protein
MQPPAPVVSPAPNAAVNVPPSGLWPTLGPTYPRAGVTGALVIALAYFSLGVAVGAFLKPSPFARRLLPFLVAPGIVAGLAFMAWVLRSFR